MSGHVTFVSALLLKSLDSFLKSAVSVEGIALLGNVGEKSLDEKDVVLEFSIRKLFHYNITKILRNTYL